MGNLVCIGFSEALSAPEVAWSLLDGGFEVIAFARRGRRSGLHHSSRVTVVEITPPEDDADAALKDLEKLLAVRSSTDGGRHVIFPLDDAALWLCDRLELKDGWVMAGARGAMADLALDKEIQIRAAQAAELKVPATSIAATVREVLEAGKDLPLVLRPVGATNFSQGRLQKGRNWICGSQEELERMVSEWNEAWPLLVQPFIKGNGEGIFGLATDEGVQAWSAHRRLRMMNPHGSGSSACVSNPVPDDAKLAVERFIKKTGWRGLFMVELLRDHSGFLWFVEFNGRPWGSMALSRRQGLEYPAWAVNWALNPRALPPVKLTLRQRVVCRNVGRELMHLLFVLRGPKSKALKEWPSFWRAILQVLLVRPSDTFYNWRKGDLRVFLNDVWYTVRDNLKKPRKSPR